MRDRARLLLRRMVRRDVALRLAWRAGAWASASLAAYGLLLLLAVALADSRLALPPLAFHGLALTIAGSLPAFLAYPFRPRIGTALVRRVDTEASVEAWLEYRGGPAAPIVARRALLALEVASLKGSWRPRPRGPELRAVLAAAASGALSLALAQGLSIAGGRGLSLGYPRQRMTDIVAERLAASEAPETVAVEPGLLEDGSPRGGPGSRQSRPEGVAPSLEALESPDFVAASKDPSDSPGTAARRGPAERAPGSGEGRQGPSADGRASGGSPERGSRATGAGERGGSEASSPGYEGRGRALEGSPLVDYRARLERELTEATGREYGLGSSPSPELVSEAIRDYYASFDLRVSVGAERDPYLGTLQAAWAAAFGGRR